MNPLLANLREYLKVYIGHVMRKWVEYGCTVMDILVKEVLRLVPKKPSANPRDGLLGHKKYGISNASKMIIITHRV